MSRLAVLLSIALAGCGAPRTRTSEPTELLTLSEARAMEIVAEVLAEEGIARGASWTVQITPETELDVDVRLASSSFGIEWMSPQDRADLGEAIPGPAAEGRLRIVPGIGADESAQVLVLEHTTYRHANDREAVQSGAPGAGDAEGRLRRDVRDFLHHVRGQGGL